MVPGSVKTVIKLVPVICLLCELLYISWKWRNFDIFIHVILAATLKGKKL